MKRAGASASHVSSTTSGYPTPLPHIVLHPQAQAGITGSHHIPGRRLRLLRATQGGTVSKGVDRNTLAPLAHDLSPTRPGLAKGQLAHWSIQRSELGGHQATSADVGQGWNFPAQP